MRRLRAFGAFWYDFIVGDDWVVAVGVVVALSVTYLMAHHARAGAWLVVPAAVVLLLPTSIWRAVRKSG